VVLVKSREVILKRVAKLSSVGGKLGVRKFPLGRLWLHISLG